MITTSPPPLKTQMRPRIKTSMQQILKNYKTTLMGTTDLTITEKQFNNSTICFISNAVLPYQLSKM